MVRGNTVEANIRVSRIGRAPVTIPAGVSAVVKDQVVTIKGKLGELSHAVHPSVKVVLEGQNVLLSVEGDHRSIRALHGLSRALIQNMVVGVATGYEKKLNLVGVGYRASVVGTNLKLEVGKSHEVLIPFPKGVSAEVSKKQDEVVLRCIDKQVLGQFAADVIRQRPVEPYKGKGIRHAGQIVKLKAGKKAGRK
ncbi:MAG: 50S ribosomal protein L6 [Candidatus Cloacimonetes bacterium]|nr:50S ribosomal protein L6 [Candidatus Cloacimonadota bacterium]